MVQLTVFTCTWYKSSPENNNDLTQEIYFTILKQSTIIES